MEGHIFHCLSLSLFQSRCFVIQTLLPALITSLYTCDRSDLCHQSSPKIIPTRTLPNSRASLLRPPVQVTMLITATMLIHPRASTSSFPFGSSVWIVRPPVCAATGPARLRMGRALVKARVRQGRWKCSSVHTRLCWQSATLELVPSECAAFILLTCAPRCVAFYGGTALQDSEDKLAAQKK